MEKEETNGIFQPDDEDLKQRWEIIDHNDNDINGYAYDAEQIEALDFIQSKL